MAKKIVQRVKIYSNIFTGYLDEIPQEAKDRMFVEKPKVYEDLFGKTEEVIY